MQQMKRQVVLIWICGFFSVVLLVLSILLRVWQHPLGLKISASFMGLCVLITTVLIFGKRR